MAKPELGVKRRCAACGAAFYDLNREPIVCPKCSTEFVVEQPKPTRRKREPEPAKPAPVAAPAPEATDSEESSDNEVDDFLEDDIEEDEDVGEVIDGATGQEEET